MYVDYYFNIIYRRMQSWPLRGGSIYISGNRRRLEFYILLFRFDGNGIA